MISKAAIQINFVLTEYEGQKAVNPAENIPWKDEEGGAQVAADGIHQIILLEDRQMCLSSDLICISLGEYFSKASHKNLLL